MLENIQSYITSSAQSTETFDEYYMKYIMDVQDKHIDIEMNKLFNSPSFQKMIELDKEANNLHREMLKGM